MTTTPVGNISFKLFNAAGQQVKKALKSISVDMTNKPSWVNTGTINKTTGDITVQTSGEATFDIKP